ncbi:MAG: DNA replication/repair protein RecF [Gammaproteobacteria bacterium]|nr:DNA replication/repair protein RecF [Gammaproteobacteria bacterium]MCH9743696.1 DNA replication/repair protein RecF [Gammaproteobacteria bacterium]
MILDLQVTHFRNLSQLHLPYCSQYNVFYGKNGSGKTSILESIYYLSMFKSFRTSAYQRLLQYHKDSFSIFIKLQRDKKLIPIGVQRDNTGAKQIRINGEKVNSIALLAKQLPVIMINPHTYRFFHDGPKVRRSFMDFGLFHVKQEFYDVWKQYQHVLKQRNACLKQRAARNEVEAWASDFCSVAELIHQYRKEYLAIFELKYLALLEEILPDYKNLKLKYNPGWDIETSLATLLEQTYYADSKVGFTQQGPHRADLQLYYDNDIPVQDVFSQGQQKLASYALYLTQGAVLQQLEQVSPIYLIDDLPSELDCDRNSQIVEILKQINAQIFVTGVEKRDLESWADLKNMKMFHVKQGVASGCQQEIV